MSTPIPDSYWVEPGRLLAGEYPGAPLDADALPRLQAFATAGITSFIDLTEADEGLSPYEHLLPGGTRHRRMPIRDQGCPSDAEMLAILDLIDEELRDQHVVYVHCWGGHGRTGLVVGCWLARQGFGGDEALRRVAELRAAVPDANWRDSPETAEQEALVRSWPVTDATLRLRRALAAAAAVLEASGLDTVREIRDLTPALKAALQADYPAALVAGGRVPIPGWPDVGGVDLLVKRSSGRQALTLAAELKTCAHDIDKVHEGIWDLFKMAQLATRSNVTATFLVTAASEQLWQRAFCRDLFQDTPHTPQELCRRRFPTGSRELAWDWLLKGGYDHFPRSVPAEIETRLVADQALIICGRPWRLRAVHVGVRSDEIVPFGGWPNGERPPDAKRPLRTLP